ncbi:hypothetical protein MTR67_026248 [Solanum verrucosum]|uniref:Uncharacterized protein n=1 Tax=Solanum verrucosum TaxID=315347 RepID=A0AAF0R1B8_SOLVR|nr:hypothetical protein MTR67_026248 [Solanum verrucosum]
MITYPLPMIFSRNSRTSISYCRLLLFGVDDSWWLTGRSFCSPEKQRWRGEEEQQSRCCCWHRGDGEGQRERRGRGEERRATSPLVLTGDGGQRWVAASPEMADREETRRNRRRWGATDLEKRKMRNLGLGLLIDKNRKARELDLDPRINLK